MKNMFNIDNQVEETMRSLDGMQSASPGPFFYTRVMARLDSSQKSIWENISAFIARPVVAFAVICLVIIMNTIAVVQKKEAAPFFADQMEQVTEDDLNLAVNTFYDYEIKEP